MNLSINDLEQMMATHNFNARTEKDEEATEPGEGARSATAAVEAKDGKVRDQRVESQTQAVLRGHRSQEGQEGGRHEA